MPRSSPRWARMSAEPRVLLTVDGIDGSGKSTFARRIHGGLVAAGLPAVLVKVDDFRRPVDWTSAPTEAEVYYDAYYDLADCDACLRAFATGAPSATVPVFDIPTERRTGTRTLALEGIEIAVLEGVFPLRLPTAAEGVLIYLQTTEAEARRRIIGRDLRKGRTQAEIERRIDQRYFPTQRRYHAQFTPVERADLVIDNERPAMARTIRRDLGRLPARVRQALEPLLPPA